MSGIKDLFKTRRQAYKKIFESEEGRVVLADLYKFCGVENPTYVEGDSHGTAYREGMRRVALRIKGILKQDDEQIERLIKDQSEVIQLQHKVR